MVFAQPWLQNLPKEKSKHELNFYDYKKAFETYWAPFHVDKEFYFENGKKIKASGWKQFKRWEYAMEGEINPSTGEFPKVPANVVYENYLKSNPRSRSPKSANWTSLGTNFSNGGYAGIGRINCVAFHPSNNNIYWVGAASGGLWVTINDGMTWNCLTDNNAVLAVSSIIIPSDFAVSHTIYIATGDRDHWDNNGTGVLKSTNSGTTWFQTGLSYSINSYEMAKKLLLDPNNNQTLLAATGSGVFKTTNGGTTWNNQLTTTDFIDIESKPGNFNTIYGSTGSGEIYITTNGGSSWALAFSDTGAQRIELAVSPNQQAWVYAMAAGRNNGLYGVYKSTNSGTSFFQVYPDSLNLLGWSAYGTDQGGQGWYDLSLAVSPSDANNLFVGGVNTWSSNDGGYSWTLINHWWGDGGVQAVHADKHVLYFRTNGDLFEGNDGGIYLSNDGGYTWNDKTNGIEISQMYKLGVSATDSSVVITGLQDNGTKLMAGGTWNDVIGGDGMECLIDYTDLSIQYGELYYGSIVGTFDYWTSSQTISDSIHGAHDGAWVTPFIIDPTDNNTLYAGYADIWKTTDQGLSWTQISNIGSHDKFRVLAIAPSNTNYLYAAETDTLWKTSDGGTTWIDITGTLPVSAGSIKSLAVKNNDENTVWVSFGGYNSSRVFQTTDGGNTWFNISNGLPQVPVYSIVQNKQSASQVQLYAGTETGVFLKNGSSNWTQYNSGLPNVKIGELEIFYSNNPQASKIRAATFGRGLWESFVYTTSTGIEEVAEDPSFNVYPNPAMEELFIEVPGNTHVTNFEILNSYGKTVYLGKITGKAVVSTGNFSSGLYIVKLGNGKSREFRKIIKK